MMMLGAFYGLPFLPQLNGFEMFLPFVMLVAVAVAVLAMYYVFERRLLKQIETASSLEGRQQSAVLGTTKSGSPEVQPTCTCEETERVLQRLCLGDCR